MLLSRAGGGDHPSCLGGRGLGPPRLAGQWRGWGGGRAAASLLPLWVAARGTPSWPPSCRRRTPRPACACGRGRGAAPGLGGVRGGPWTAPPGAPADLNPPSALPERAVVTGGSCGARPPYCSGAPPCAAPNLGVRVAPARWCGLALRPRPLREQVTGGAGARGVQVQPHPPPPPRVVVPSGGGGASPRLQGGGGPLLWLPSCWEGTGGGGWEGRPPAPPPRRASAYHPLSSASPPGVYSCRGGCRAAAGVSRGPVGRQRVSAAGGGGGGRGGNPPALVRATVFPGPASDRAAPFAPSWAPPVCRRPAAGRACGRLPRPRCPRTPGAAASSGGVRGRRFLGLPPSALEPEWEGRGEVGGGLWSPGAAS